MAFGTHRQTLSSRQWPRFKPSDWTVDGLPIVRIQNLNDHAKPFNRYNGRVDQRVLIDSEKHPVVMVRHSWHFVRVLSMGARSRES